MAYIENIELSVNDSTGAIDGQNINGGLSGDAVYVVPVYTDSRSLAAHGFELHLSYIKYYSDVFNFTESSTSMGTPPFRYIYAHRDLRPHGNLISQLYLRSSPMGDGHTDNLNADRPGAKTLYLCWTYAPHDHQWKRISNGNFKALQIVATVGKLYARSSNEIWSYDGSRWDKLDTNDATVQIAADNTRLYQRHKQTGQIWRWDGPYRGWVKLDENWATVDIAAAGGNLYQRHEQTGQIWRYNSGTWVKIDENKDTAEIAVTDDKVFQRHDHGNQIWAWSLSDPTWRRLDMNKDSSSIVAGGGNVYQMHNAIGQAWVFNRSWFMLDENTDNVQLVPAGGFVYLRHSTGEVFQYQGDGQIWESLGLYGKQTDELAASDDGEVYVRMKDGEIWHLG